MTNMELYGTNDVPTIPKSITDDRIKLLNEHLKSIIDNGMMVKESYRISKILQAIKFWNTMSEGEESHE